jgi:cyanophycinase
MSRAWLGGAGPLLIIGGAEDKLGSKVILNRFVRLAGGAQARIVVISTASSLGDEATEIYRVLFSGLGVADVRGVRPVTREQAEAADLADAVAEATGVFMTGGNQTKLTQVVAGTRLGDAILNAHDRGAVVAGTSAGASAVSSHMVSFGAEGPMPRQRMAHLSAGLGLLPGVIVDQHFTERNRVGRLLALVASSPTLLGVGIDEDTAILVTTDGTFEVIGRGAVLVVDGSRVETNAYDTRRSQPLMVSGAILHTLPTGYRFSLAERRVLTSLTVVGAPEQIHEVRARTARRVAREGVGRAIRARGAGDDGGTT